MPRPKRVCLPGVPQHVVQRGNNRQAVFFHDEDYRAYLTFLHQAAEKTQTKIHAWVLMTNHTHLLLTPSLENGMSLIMQDLGRRYVTYINATYQRTGTLWEGRFKSSMIDSDHYCLACYRYIELNPVRANMVEHPRDYQWSSYHVNANGELSDLIALHDAYLLLGKNSLERQMAYRELFATIIDQETVEAIRYASRKCLPVGNKRFKEQIESSLGVLLGSGRRGRPRKPEC